MSAIDPRHMDAIRNSFAAQSLMQTLGASLDRLDPGSVEITAPILPGARKDGDGDKEP